MTQDTLLIQGLSINAIIGVYPWERQIKQTITLDLELAYDSGPGANTDNLQDAVDYAELCQNITELVATSQYQLIESLANAIANWLQTQGHETFKLTLYKPRAVKNAQQIALKIERP